MVFLHRNTGAEFHEYRQQHEVPDNHEQHSVPDSGCHDL